METLTKERRSIDDISGYYVEDGIIYPESDGELMADNTEQFDWIVKIKENLESMYKKDPLVFVAGDLLWYPVKGDNQTRRAPDAMVVFGRPKGRRGSYLTWKEEGINPQIVFAILSPNNTRSEMLDKLDFYDTYEVEEYYMYDPDEIVLKGWIRMGTHLVPIENMNGWVSPRLEIRFDMSGEKLEIFTPDGQRFLSPVELSRQSELYRQRAEKERHRAEKERQRAERLAAVLKKMGIEPDEI